LGVQLKYVRELGADEVINYRAEDVFQRAKAIAGDRGIDAIVGTIGPSNGVDNLGLLGPEGGLACIAGIPDLSVVPDPLPNTQPLILTRVVGPRSETPGKKVALIS